MTDKVMPIMIDGEDIPGYPRRISFSLLNEKQAYENHGQSLEKLANRGGLSPCEAVAIIECRKWKSMPIRDAVYQLIEAIKQVE